MRCKNNYEYTKIHVSARNWLSVYTAGKMWKNEPLINVEKSKRWIFGYPKMWKNDVCGCL